jgi:hypothetical protein
MHLAAEPSRRIDRHGIRWPLSGTPRQGTQGRTASMRWTCRTKIHQAIVSSKEEAGFIAAVGIRSAVPEGVDVESIAAHRAKVRRSIRLRRAYPDERTLSDSYR